MDLQEKTRKALQACANEVLKTKDPDLRPRAYFNEQTGGFVVQLDFEQHAVFFINNLDDAKPENVKERLKVIKTEMVRRVRERMDKWEKE